MKGSVLLRDGGQFVDVSGATGQQRYKADLDAARKAALVGLDRQLQTSSEMAEQLRSRLEKALVADADHVVYLFCYVRAAHQQYLLLEFRQGRDSSPIAGQPLIERALMVQNPDKPNQAPSRFLVENFGFGVFEGLAALGFHGSTIVSAHSLFPMAESQVPADVAPEVHKDCAALFDRVCLAAPMREDRPPSRWWSRSPVSPEAMAVAAAVPVPDAAEVESNGLPPRKLLIAAGIAILCVLGMILVRTGDRTSASTTPAPRVSGSEKSGFFFSSEQPTEQETPAKQLKKAAKSANRSRTDPRRVQDPSEAAAPPAPDPIPPSPVVVATPAPPPAPPQAPAKPDNTGQKRSAALEALGVPGSDAARKRQAVQALTGR